MKTVILTLAMGVCLSFLSQAQKTDDSKKQMSAEETTKELPVMSFAETKYEFGDIQQGGIVEHSFKFTNTGKAPLLISNVRTTCGCTVPKWPKTPILPNETGEIDVKFNSAHKSGRQNKVISIVANTAAGTEKVALLGTVKTDE